MKLIIDITEEEYKRMTKASIFSTHAMINAIQNGTPLDSVIEDIKQEIGARVFDIQATSDRYFDGVDDVMDIVDEIIDKHIREKEN